MNPLEAVLRRVSADLAEMGSAWAVVGGFAVSARSEPRFTRDVDVAIAVSADTAAEAVVSMLSGRGYRLVMLSEQDAVGRTARQALNLISARGYDRERDLPTLLEAVLRGAAS